MNLNTLNKELFSASRPTPDSANEWQQTAEAKNLDLIAQKITVDIAKGQRHPFGMTHRDT